VLVRNRIVTYVVAVIANCGDVKELHVVLQTYPETSVVLIHIVNLSFDGISPERRIVAPIAGPLFATPRIPNLNQPLLLSIV